MLITVPSTLEMFNKYLLLVMVIAAAAAIVTVVAVAVVIGLNSENMLGIGK